MVKSMFAGVAGLRAHQQKMDVIGNNIANVNTWGFKSSSTSFKSSMYQTLINASAGNVEEGQLGGTNVSQVGYGSLTSAITPNFTAGSFGYTGDPKDCMIDGSGFFMAGSYSVDGKKTSDLNMTRVGDFQMKDINGELYLTDSSGNFIYGFSASPDGQLSETVDPDTLKVVDGDNPDTLYKPIRLPNINEAGERVSFDTLTIDGSGLITGSGSDKKTYILGRIPLASVPNPQGMTCGGGPYYQTGGSSGDAVVTDAGGSTGVLKNNGLEMALVDLAREFSEMITTQRGFQANSKIITVSDEMLQELVNMKR